MFSAWHKAALALMLGMLGLCTAPAAQAARPRLLFLGISKDGRAQQQAERAVQLRLEGLDVMVIRPKANDLPPCERADCLAAALASEGTELALTARILKNEYACLATLIFLTNNKAEKTIEQDLACRSDAKESELFASLSDSAAGLTEEYIKKSEPAPATGTLVKSLSRSTEGASNPDQGYRWSTKKKALVAAFGTLLLGSMAATITLAAMSPNFATCQDQACVNFTSNRPATAISAALSGIAAASLGFSLVYKQF
jgi:hypothetical protein